MEGGMEEEELLKMRASSADAMVIGLENAHQVVVIEDGSEMDTETVIATWMIVVTVDGIAPETVLKVETSMKLATSMQWRGMVHLVTGMGCLNTTIIISRMVMAGGSGAMTGTDTQEVQVIGMETWDRCVMREELIEADQVLMTVLAELEVNVGSLFDIHAYVFGFRDMSQLFSSHEIFNRLNPVRFNKLITLNQCTRTEVKIQDFHENYHTKRRKLWHYNGTSKGTKKHNTKRFQSQILYLTCEVVQCRNHRSCRKHEWHVVVRKTHRWNHRQHDLEWRHHQDALQHKK